MINVTLLGHACILIDTGHQRILCDPHLFDQFGNGLFAIYPRRRIDRERIEKPDIIFISHHHRDHFDLRSLALLDRNTPVLFPHSAEIAYGLQSLGFTDLNPFDDWDELEIAGGVRLVFTPSRYRVPENGLLVMTEREIVWNLVDTIIDLEMVARAREVLGGRTVDLLLWPYQPLLEVATATNDSLEFALAKFDLWLASLYTIAPRGVVPYADAQFCVGDTRWLNHYRFPVEFSEVNALIARACAGAQVVNANPGDRIEVSPDRLALVGRAAYVTPIESTAEDRNFDTTTGVPTISSTSIPHLMTPIESFGETRSKLERGWRALTERLAVPLQVAAEWNVAYDMLIEDCDTVHGLRFLPGLVTPRLVSAAEMANGPGNRVVIRTQLGVLQRLLSGELHFVNAYLSSLFRTWHRVFRYRHGRFETPRMMDEFGIRGVSSFGSIPPGQLFLNQLLAGNGVDLKQAYIEKEIAEARHGND